MSCVIENNYVKIRLLDIIPNFRIYILENLGWPDVPLLTELSIFLNDLSCYPYKYETERQIFLLFIGAI